MSQLPTEFIASTDALVGVCAEALDDTMYGLDTEFVRDRTYYPKVALIQLATSRRIALIDPLAGLDLEPLFDLLDDTRSCPVMHAATQDLELLWLLSGRLPKRLFDTQLAAAFVGLGQQTSYGNLVRQVLSVSLDKGEQFTDWMQRPLDPSQVRYAADDVRYLTELHEVLSARLEERGRLAVVLEEQEKQLVPSRFELDENSLLKKVKGARGLPPNEQGAARSLAVWRERTAQTRDIPRKWVLSDDALVAIAKRKATHINDLRRIRGIHPNEARRSGAEIVAAVAQGLSRPVHKSAKESARARLSAEAELAVDFMKPLLKLICQREQIAPASVGTSALLEDLAQGYLDGTLDTAPPLLLEGWRELLVGSTLRGFLEGKLSVHLKSDSLEPILHSTEGSSE